MLYVTKLQKLSDMTKPRLVCLQLKNIALDNMKKNIISFFILNIFLLIGCSSDNNSSEVDETFSVSGKIVDSDGCGLANISLTIGNQTVCSSASGEWSVSNLKGSVKITPMADGYTFTPASATASSTQTVTFKG